jgi:hypothetical protein
LLFVFAPDTTSRHQKSAVNSTKENQLSTQRKKNQLVDQSIIYLIITLLLVLSRAQIIIDAF